MLWWLAGGVALRSKAVAIFTEMEPTLQLQLLELACPEWSVAEVIALQEHPLGTRPWARLAGGLLGLGGLWNEPLVLLHHRDKPVVCSGAKSWEILADAFGVEVLSLSETDDAQKEHVSRRKSWHYEAEKITDPSGVSYPFPWGKPPVVLKGVEYADGLAALVSQDLFSVLVLYRGKT